MADNVFEKFTRCAKVCGLFYLLRFSDADWLAGDQQSRGLYSKPKAQGRLCLTFLIWGDFPYHFFGLAWSLSLSIGQSMSFVTGKKPKTLAWKLIVTSSCRFDCVGRSFVEILPLNFSLAFFVTGHLSIFAPVSYSNISTSLSVTWDDSEKQTNNN